MAEVIFDNLSQGSHSRSMNGSSDNELVPVAANSYLVLNLIHHTLQRLKVQGKLHTDLLASIGLFQDGYLLLPHARVFGNC